MKTWHMAAWALAVLAMIGTAARADDPGPTVTVTGNATAPQKAQTLRMTYSITAKGSDIRDATAKLKQERDDTKAKLLAAGAVESSIKFTDPSEGEQAASEQQREMQQIMMAEGRGAAASQPSTGVTVSTVLTAEWTLADASPDDALVAINELESKIKSAMPKAAADTTPKTPEEQEIAQEMAARTGADANADEPTYVFVHKLTEDDRAKLLAQAYADAQAHAKRVADAAGKQVGLLIHLSDSKGDSENPGAAYVQAMIEARSGASTNTDDEAIGQEPGSVDYTVSVTATFSLK